MMKITPDSFTASSIASSLLQKYVLNCERILTGNQNIVYYILSFIKSAGLKIYNNQVMNFNIDKLIPMLNKAYSYFKNKHPHCFIF